LSTPPPPRSPLFPYTTLFRSRLSLMAVPTYVTRTDGLDPEDGRGTGAVGAGAELRVGSRYAVTGEWVVQTSGVQDPFQSASLGLDRKSTRLNSSHVSISYAVF